MVLGNDIQPAPVKKALPAMNIGATGRGNNWWRRSDSSTLKNGVPSSRAMVPVPFLG